MKNPTNELTLNLKAVTFAMNATDNGRVPAKMVKDAKNAVTGQIVNVYSKSMAAASEMAIRLTKLGFTPLTNEAVMSPDKVVPERKFMVSYFSKDARQPFLAAFKAAKKANPVKIEVVEKVAKKVADKVEKVAAAATSKKVAKKAAEKAPKKTAEQERLERVAKFEAERK